MIYLIHFDQPYHHARHYIGFVEDLDHLMPRLMLHKQGHGARLMEVINNAGISWRLARTWQGDRTQERRLKNQKNTPRLCPICNPSAAPAPVALDLPEWSDVQEIPY